jgi:hypothetical protein
LENVKVKINSEPRHAISARAKLYEEKSASIFTGEKNSRSSKTSPAEVCQQCGEKYLHSTVYKALEKLSISCAKPASRLSDDVVRFKKTA